LHDFLRLFDFFDREVTVFVNLTFPGAVLDGNDTSGVASPDVSEPGFLRRAKILELHFSCSSSEELGNL
tara:strand:+ start:388 stop:594 length:207 start_codon:yes stop_codon:yes gene_type:complete